MRNLTKKLSYAIYIVLACVFTSCLDKVQSTKENPFIITKIESIGDGLYKYRGDGHNTGDPFDFIILDIMYPIGDTLFISNAR